MEQKDRLIIEGLLGVIFIMVLIILIVILTNSSPFASSSNSIQTQVVETSTQKQRHCEYVKVPVSRSTTYYNYDHDYDYLDYREYPLKYKSRSRDESKKDFLGRYKNEYFVYVKNTDKRAGYFTVKFEFEDYYGDEVGSDSITKYIYPGEEERFYHVAFSRDKYEYDDWSYRVIPGKRKVSTSRHHYYHDCDDHYDYRYAHYPVRYKTEQRCYWIWFYFYFPHTKSGKIMGKIFKWKYFQDKMTNTNYDKGYWICESAVLPAMESLAAYDPANVNVKRKETVGNATRLTVRGIEPSKVEQILLPFTVSEPNSD